MLLSSTALAQEKGTEEAGGPPPALPQPLGKIDTARGTGQGSLMTALEAYEAWLRRFDGKFASAEERIARASQGLDALEFEVLGDVGVRAEARVTHAGDPGAYFLLEEIRYLIDGRPITSRLDPSGALGGGEPAAVFAGRIVPGAHILSVEMVFRVRGFQLLSSEMRSTRFRVKNAFRFEAKDGYLSQIKVVGRDTGGGKSPAGQSISQVQKRFQIAFELSETRLNAAPAPAPAPASAPSSSPASAP